MKCIYEICKPYGDFGSEEHKHSGDCVNENEPEEEPEFPVRPTGDAKSWYRMFPNKNGAMTGNGKAAKK
jgi:hypothetical protein